MLELPIVRQVKRVPDRMVAVEPPTADVEHHDDAPKSIGAWYVEEVAGTRGADTYVREFHLEAAFH